MVLPEKCVGKINFPMDADTVMMQGRTEGPWKLKRTSFLIRRALHKQHQMKTMNCID